ncbi:inositol polyphosphate 5-phosphatase OCRL-1, putative, partial [Entamoeba invadens IP1]
MSEAEILDRVDCTIDRFYEMNDFMLDPVVNILYTTTETTQQETPEAENAVIEFVEMIDKKAETKAKDVALTAADSTDTQLNFQDEEFTEKILNEEEVRENTISGYISRNDELDEKYGDFSTQVSDEEILIYLKNRNEWIGRMLEKLSSEYRESKELKVSCHTYNVDQHVFEPEYLSEWIDIDFESDIIVVATQELDMDKEHIFLGSKKTTKGEAWRKNLLETVKRKGNYQYITHRQMCGIVIFMYAKPDIANLMKNVSTACLPVGTMKCANKGGVAIRFDMLETSFCFVNSHLAAHIEPEKLRKRNEHWNTIWKDLKFDKKGVIGDHDYVIWMGDLNYRIQMDDKEVRDKVEKGMFEELFEHDQLHTAMLNKIVFNGFNEAKITFKPTFKIDIGSDVYNAERVPSWCDRVLIRKQNAYPSQILNYTSHAKMLQSDHKPVSCCFLLYPSKLFNDKLEEVQCKLWKMSDYIEQKLIPQVEVKGLELLFENVELSSTYVQSLEIKNVGNYPTKFQFEQRPDTRMICPVYYKVSVTEGVIKPGESVEIKVTLFIQPDQAMLVSKKEVTDIFSLSFAFGGIYFVTSRMVIKDTIFGKDLKTLVYSEVPYCQV